jgi:hypothetical protein
MAYDWLYGPEITESFDGFDTRALELDLDTVLEAAAMASTSVTAAAGNSTMVHTKYLVYSKTSRDVDESDLRTLAAEDKQRISVQIAAASGIPNIRINLGSTPGIPTVSTEGMDRLLARSVADYLIDKGRPRIAWRRVASFAPLAVAFIVAGLWFMWMLSNGGALLGPYGSALTGILVGVAVGALIALALWTRRLAAGERPPHRVLDHSRERVSLDRANTRRDVKVAVFSSPIPLAAGFLLAVLTNAFGLKG